MDPAQLLSMNKALVVEMHEKRLKIKRIIQKCEQLYKSRSAAESSYRCIRRHWQQVSAPPFPPTFLTFFTDDCGF